MSTPIPVEVIAEALAKHQPRQIWPGNPKLVCRNPDCYSCDWSAAHQASVIAALPDIAVVQIPESEMGARENVAEPIRGLPMWDLDGAWACWREESVIEFEADGQSVYGDIDPSAIPGLVGVLLAAARAAGGEL